MNLPAGHVWMHPPRDLTPQPVPEGETALKQALGWLHADPPSELPESGPSPTPAFTINYPCGCSASGSPNLPPYCSEHGKPEAAAAAALVPAVVTTHRKKGGLTK